MRPRVATVLSARPWEADFVTAARATAAVRVVSRAYEPGDIGVETDVVVVGSEVAWVTAALLRRWQDAGLRVLGIHPRGDKPGKAMLTAGGVQEIRDEDTGSIELVATARLLGLATGRRRSSGRIVAVTGPSGAPGRTDIALLTALAAGGTERTVLVDLDRQAPSLSLRLGLSPRPDVADAFETLGDAGAVADSSVRSVDSLSVVTGTFARPALDATAARDITWALARAFDRVVVDAGPYWSTDPIVPIAEEVLFVCDATPTGLIRAAAAVMEWTGPQPTLVLNRLVGDPAETIAAARRAIGLEPTIRIPYDEDIRLSATLCTLPPATTWHWMSHRAA